MLVDYERVDSAYRPGLAAHLVDGTDDRLLVGDRDAGSPETGFRQRTHGLTEDVGGDGQQLKAPVGQAKLGERGVLHGRRTAVRHGPADHPKPYLAHLQTFGSRPPSSARLAL